MEIQKDFKELLELLNANKVEYIIVGGYALAFHGAPRFTGDIDLYVKPDTENAKRILDALSQFGFSSLNLTADDFISPDQVIQLGHPPVRIDIMAFLTAVNWQKADAGKVPGKYGDVPVYFIGKNELVINKKNLNRKKDLADLEALGQD